MIQRRHQRFELTGKWRHRTTGTKYTRVWGYPEVVTLVDVETEAGSTYCVRKKNIEQYTDEEVSNMAKKANTIGLGEYTDDDLITELENRNVVPRIHSVNVAFADFGMRHTLRCTVKDKRTCIYHQWLNDKYIENQGMSPFSPAGEYALEMDAQGEMHMRLIKEDKESI